MNQKYELERNMIWKKLHEKSKQLAQTIVHPPPTYKEHQINND